MIQVSVLRPEVAGELPNVPNPVVDQYLVRSVRMLCEEAAVWQKTGFIQLDGDDLLDITELQDSDSEVIAVMPRGIVRGNTRLGRMIAPSEDEGEGYYIVSSRKVKVVNPGGNTFGVTARMRPKLRAKEIPEDVIGDHHQVIIHGALYRLYSMPNQKWSNQESAQFHYQSFLAGAAEARVNVTQQWVES